MGTPPPSPQLPFLCASCSRTAERDAVQGLSSTLPTLSSFTPSLPYAMRGGAQLGYGAHPVLTFPFIF